MKNIFVAFALCLLANPAFGAVINSVTLDASMTEVLVDVTYGGCKKHTFTTENGICIMSAPGGCSYELVEDKKGDTCKTPIHDVLVFSLWDDFWSTKNDRGWDLTIYTKDADGKASDGSLSIP